MFAVLAGLASLETCRLETPEPVPDSAPTNQFSATRAIATLHAVSLDEPHPLGTPAHDVVRDQIAAALRALDYTVDVQDTFACNPIATCGEITNLIARRPGQVPGGKAVVVVAHYDSVPAGPGASDDGTGVASALEIARAIRHDELTNPVVFLIDDGEEGGLLGAEGFVADAARSNDAAFVINLEARGTTGTPFLFETSREQRWLVPVMAHALPHPVTTSLFATIYDQLPNDTDLTVFKRAGRAGINFAYVGGGTQYHTPLDRFANVDAGSVQRRGDQALAMVRAFGAADLANLNDAAPNGAVWFDVFAAFVVWWPAGWTVWITAVALVLVLVALVRGMRHGKLTIGGVAIGGASFVGSVALAAALGVGLTRLFGWKAPGALFEPHPEPKIAAAWLVGIAAALAVSALARRRASFDAVFIGHALAWNGLALAVAVMLPGAAYLFAVPGLVMAVFAVARATLPVGDMAASVGPLIGAATLCLPFALLGHDTLGDASLTVAAVLLALITTTFAPLLSDTAPRLPLGCLGLAGALAIVAALIPRQSATHPRHLPLAYVLDGDSGSARWQVDGPTPEVRAAAPFEPARRLVAPWYGALGTSDVALAPAEVLAPPAAAVSTAAGDGARAVTLDLMSARHAPRLTLLWHGDAETVAVRINGVTPPTPGRRRGSLAPGWHRIIVRSQAAHVELTLRGTAPVEAILIDTSFGLPAAAAALIRARDASGAVPVHDGDVTIVEHHFRW